MRESDALDTFPGAVVQFVLDEIQKDDMAATAWQGQDEDVKRDRLDQMIARADSLAQSLVRAVETQGMTRVQASLDEVQFKKGVKIVLTASKSQEALFDLAHEAGGASVYILVPQLAMNLTTEGTQADAFEDEDAAGGSPGWTPPDDDGPDGPMGDDPDDDPDAGNPGPPHPDGFSDDDPDRPPREGEAGFIRPPGIIHDSEPKKDRTGDS